jgi:diaminopimelate decarboxylase/aspartate kinase
MTASSQRPFVVLKFGGTSVASRERWETIASILEERIESGYRPYAVCSAVSGVSDRLEAMLETTRRDGSPPSLEALRARHLELADELEIEIGREVEGYVDDLERLLEGASLIGEVSPRLRARVMAAGELMSSRLGAAFLESRGFDVRWHDARRHLEAVDQAGANAQRDYLSATCSFEPDDSLQSTCTDSGADLHLTQGFIAGNADGDTVLLGRGGSDTSAACFAAKLEADRLEIWTDVPGMFTANPDDVPSAHLLTQLDYEEAQELATMGAEVLHPRCIDPVREERIPLHIRWMESPDVAGTRISDDVPNVGPQVKAISAKDDLTLVSMETLGMWQEVGFLADAFECFKRNGISIDLVATSETNVTVSLDPKANALDDETIRGLLEDLDPICDAQAIEPCAAVSLVGTRIRSILHELGPALEVFDEQSVHLVSQAASDLNFTFVVDEEQEERLVRKLHALLFDDRGDESFLGPTWRELNDDVSSPEARIPSAWWVDRREALLACADDRSPTYVYDLDRIDRAIDQVCALEGVERRFYAVKANPHPDILERVAEAGLGFECVSPGEVERVRATLPEIEPERILFTPNFAGREEYVFGFEHAGWVTVDNLHPLERWPEVFEGREILVRLDPGRGRGHHEFVRTAGARSKFGVSRDQIGDLKPLVDAAGATVVGLHAHLGSGITSPEAWTEAGLFLAEVAEDFPDVRILNLGGGLGVGERAGQSALDLEALGDKLASFDRTLDDVDVWLEPGRFLVADAGVLLAEVTQIKHKSDLHYVGLETGMNSLIRPALYGAYHEILNLSRLGAPPAIEADVVGPICESGDVLGRERPLPETEEGDILLIAQTGAYGRTMSSRYNLREPAGEVVLGD